jgi:hypothetical protein
MADSDFSSYYNLSSAAPSLDLGQTPQTSFDLSQTSVPSGAGFSGGYTPSFDLSQTTAPSAAGFTGGYTPSFDIGQISRPSMDLSQLPARSATPSWVPDYRLSAALPRAPGALDLSQPSTPSAAPSGAWDYAKQLFGSLSTADMARLGLAGGLSLLGASQARRAAAQNRRLRGEMEAIAQPYRQQGAELQRKAMAGELTPEGQQSLQALQAQMAQNVAATGGVGAAQAATQVEAFRQRLLENQYNYGLQISNIGDQIALGAIRSGMEADQQLAQANQAFYSQLAMIGAGMFPSH